MPFISSLSSNEPAVLTDSQMPLTSYLELLRRGGTLVQLGAPDDGKLPVEPFSLIFSNRHIAGSGIGSPNEIREMLELALKKNIRPWIDVRPMSDANSAIIDMENGCARYRYVLANDQ